MDKRISIYPEHVEIKLTLPWEVAQAIVSDGPSIIKALSVALKQREAEAEANSPIKRYETGDSATEDDRWLKLYRTADRQIRALRAAEGITDAKAKSRVANDLNVPTTTLSAVLTRFRRERRERLTARRNANVIRMHLLGETNSRIKSRLKVSFQTIAKILNEEDDLVRSLRKYRNTALYRPPAEALEQPAISREERERNHAKTLTENLRQRQRQKHHTGLGVQFYRQLRRLKFDNSKRWWALKEIATPHGLHPDYVAQLISARKHKVRTYLKRRRGQTIVRLMDQGLMQKEIAERFKVSATVIGRRYDAYLEMHRAHPDLYPLRKKGSKDQ